MARLLQAVLRQKTATVSRSDSSTAAARNQGGAPQGPPNMQGQQLAGASLEIEGSLSPVQLP